VELSNSKGRRKKPSNKESFPQEGPNRPAGVFPWRKGEKEIKANDVKHYERRLGTNSRDKSRGKQKRQGRVKGLVEKHKVTKGGRLRLFCTKERAVSKSKNADSRSKPKPQKQTRRGERKTPWPNATLPSLLRG